MDAGAKFVGVASQVSVLNFDGPVSCRAIAGYHPSFSALVSSLPNHPMPQAVWDA